MRIDEGIIDEDNLENNQNLPKRQLTTKSSKLIQNILNLQHKIIFIKENINLNIKFGRAAVHTRAYGLATFKMSTPWLQFTLACTASPLP